MKIIDTYYGMIPYGFHSGLFGVTTHLAAGMAPESEEDLVIKSLETFKSRKINLLYITIDALNPPTEESVLEFLTKIVKDFSNIFIVVKNRMKKIPIWYHLAKWIIQDINIEDWKGLPCHELHAVLTKPADDPVVLTQNTHLYLVRHENADDQMMFDFVRRSNNPWKFGVLPYKRIKVRAK